jgi:hypothetical protein
VRKAASPRDGAQLKAQGYRDAKNLGGLVAEPALNEWASGKEACCSCSSRVAGFIHMLRTPRERTAQDTALGGDKANAVGCFGW